MSVYFEALQSGRLHAADFARPGDARRALKAVKRAEAEERNARTPIARTRRYWREFLNRMDSIEKGERRG